MFQTKKKIKASLITYHRRTSANLGGQKSHEYPQIKGSNMDSLIFCSVWLVNEDGLFPRKCRVHVACIFLILWRRSNLTFIGIHQEKLNLYWHNARRLAWLGHSHYLTNLAFFRLLSQNSTEFNYYIWVQNYNLTYWSL